MAESGGSLNPDAEHELSNVSVIKFAISAVLLAIITAHAAIAWDTDSVFRFLALLCLQP